MDIDFELKRYERVINDMANSLQTDVLPILHPGKPGGGYFGIPRMIFCYIGFLGLLLSGWNKKWDEEGTKKKNFGTSKQAIRYIKNILGEVDSLYRKTAEILYEMYRHGSVHIYSPKKILSKSDSKKTIEWLIYKGERESWQHYDHRSVKLRHLKIIEWEKNRFVLPISITTLYQDFIESIFLYRKIVHADKSLRLLKKFVSVVNALDYEHDKTEIKFWKLTK